VFFLGSLERTYRTQEPLLRSYCSVQFPNLEEALFKTKIYIIIIFLLTRVCSTFEKLHPVFHQRTSLPYPRKPKKSINHPPR
jgi:hypothetical protein